MPSLAVRRALRASSSQLLAAIDTTALESSIDMHVSLLESSELSQTQRHAIWTLYELNMKTFLVSSSFGWDPSEKREELFHPDQRYIILAPSESSTPSDQAPIIYAYVSFRFDVEPNMEDIEEDIVYLYELQISEQVRRKGLGRVLIQYAEQMARTWKMQKVMLTALLSNTPALNLYAKLQYTIDPTSIIQQHPAFPSLDPPQENPLDVAGIDYLILSKDVSL